MFAPRNLLIILGVLAILVGFAAGRLVGRTSSRLTFLSVGQGDCTVWQDGEVTILIDVGPRSPEGFDAGERIVVPKLRRLGVPQVAAILLTHPDSDHIGGLRAVLSRYRKAKVFASAAFRASAEFQIHLRDSGLNVDDVLWVEEDITLRLPNSSLEIAAPKLLAGASDNEGSLFIRIVADKGSAVITGDAYIATEETMQKRLKWNAQILKAGHHGSRTSSGQAFIRGLNPTWGIVSCGRDNQFGHPHPSVLKAFQDEGVEILRTDRDGDLSFVPGSAGFSRVH